MIKTGRLSRDTGRSPPLNLLLHLLLYLLLHLLLDLRHGNIRLRNDSVVRLNHTLRKNISLVRGDIPLRVSRPEDKEMLALKLASAREDSKDADDALFLMGINDVSSLQEVYDILERYIPPARLTPMASFFAEEIYNRYIHKKMD